MVCESESTRGGILIKGKDRLRNFMHMGKWCVERGWGMMCDLRCEDHRISLVCVSARAE